VEWRFNSGVVKDVSTLLLDVFDEVAGGWGDWVIEGWILSSKWHGVIGLSGNLCEQK